MTSSKGSAVDQAIRQSLKARGAPGVTEAQDNQAMRALSIRERLELMAELSELGMRLARARALEHQPISGERFLL